MPQKFTKVINVCVCVCVCVCVSVGGERMQISCNLTHSALSTAFESVRGDCSVRNAQSPSVRLGCSLVMQTV